MAAGSIDQPDWYEERSVVSQGLSMNNVECIFRKGMDPEIDSYSGFYDNEHKKDTGLLRLSGGTRYRIRISLRSCWGYCVYYTVKDALREKFEAFLIEDVER